MRKKLFGTDGLRAVAGEFPLDRSSIRKLGRGLAALLRAEGLSPRVLIGRDTRESGEWIEKALAQGLRSGGAAFASAGVIPTSAIAYLTKARDFSAGIVISASHNLYQDNGIKIFSSRGFKISDEWESRLESEILGGGRPPASEDVAIRADPTFLEAYEKYLASKFSLRGAPRRPKVVLDCANGASFKAAPAVMRSLGFDVVPTADKPDGRNINDGCGSLHPERLAAAVTETRADLGVAYDGDADRALWVDERGRVLTGDHTLYILCRAMLGANRLKAGAVVATTMSNMGLQRSVEELGLRFERTRVGDKYVLERMCELGANLGGERSGHTILLDDATTGDGILTSLKILEVMVTTGRPFSALVEGYAEFPQLLVNVRVSRRPDFRKFPEIAALLQDAERGLRGRGRVDVRYSGTEPLARIMVEGEDAVEIEDLARRIAEAMARRLS
jgi:phosphoglucosamine mutase